MTLDVTLFPVGRSTVPLDPAECAALVESPRWADLVARPADPDACWPWVGAVKPHGYPQINYAGRRTGAHRIALVARLGRDLLPWETAAHVCHDRAVKAGTCRPAAGVVCPHRRCVRPDHLEPQSRREQMMNANAPTPVPHVEIPGQLSLTDLPGVMPTRPTDVTCPG